MFRRDYLFIYHIKEFGLPKLLQFIPLDFNKIGDRTETLLFLSVHTHSTTTNFQKFNSIQPNSNLPKLELITKVK